MYYTYSDYLKNKYHEKVYKLPVNLPVTCPNRLTEHVAAISVRNREQDLKL